jgi:hypothetical protein
MDNEAHRAFLVREPSAKPGEVLAVGREHTSMMSSGYT